MFPKMSQPNRLLERLDLRIASPPLSPPPTSPLPALPPVLETQQRVTASVRVAHKLQRQTSLPNIASRNSCSSILQHDIDRDQRRLDQLVTFPDNTITAPPKSSSDSDLPGLSKRSRRDDGQLPIDLAVSRVGFRKITHTLSGSRLSSPRAPSGSVSWLNKPSEAEATQTKRKSYRSRKPPRKAIARSALYIPLPSHPVRQEQPIASSDVVVNLGQDHDNITSLPRCPSSNRSDEIMRPWSVEPPRKVKWRWSLMPPPPMDKPATKSKPYRHRLKRRTLSPKLDGNRVGGDVQKPRTTRQLLDDRAKGKTYPPTLMDPAQHAIRLPPAAQSVQMVRFIVDEESDQERQPWHLRHKKYLWVTLTVLVVLIGVAGVLGGLLWKLSRK